MGEVTPASSWAGSGVGPDRTGGGGGPAGTSRAVSEGARLAEAATASMAAGEGWMAAGADWIAAAGGWMAADEGAVRPARPKADGLEGTARGGGSGCAPRRGAWPPGLISLTCAWCSASPPRVSSVPSGRCVKPASVSSACW